MAAVYFFFLLQIKYVVFSCMLLVVKLLGISAYVAFAAGPGAIIYVSPRLRSTLIEMGKIMYLGNLEEIAFLSPLCVLVFHYTIVFPYAGFSLER
jgi:hypothetical protein